MSYHGGVRDSIASIAAAALDEQKIALSRQKKGFRRHLRRGSLTIEEKMKIPEYAAAVEFNKKHGIGERGCHLSQGYYRGKSNPATRFKKFGVRKQSVSLPKITMPMGDEE